MEIGELALTCLYAGEDFGGKDRNSHSLVLCGDYKGFHMLFTGDMGEGQGEQPGQTGRTGGDPAGYTFESCTDIENCPSWLQDIFIGSISGPIEDSISCGFLWKGNSYGHPSPETMERFRRQGIVVLETGKREP